MWNLEERNQATSLIGTEINELEYIDHIVIENKKVYFQIIHLNGNKRLINIHEIIGNA